MINDASSRSSRLEAKLDQDNQKLRDSVSDLRDLVSQMRDRIFSIHDLALEQCRIQLGQKAEEDREERAVREPEVHPEQHPQDHPQDHFQGHPRDHARIPSPHSSQSNLPRKSLSDFPPHPTVSTLEQPVVLHHELTREVGYLVGQREMNENNLDELRANLEVELQQFLEQDMIRPSLFSNFLMLIAFFLLAQHWL